MRISSGIYKGRKLPFTIPSGIRPTTDRNREMIFNVLNNIIDFEDTILLDMFAGTGVMSLEFLSRGTKSTTMIDKNHKSISLIQKNFEHIKVDKDQYQIIKGDSLKLIKDLANECNLVFVDPPYFENIYPKIIDSLSNTLKEDTLIIIESPKGMIHDFDGFELIKNKISSDSEFNILKKC